MSCQKCRHQARSWLRGELDPAEAAAVERHVSNCYFCAAVVENEGAILESMRGHYDVPPPSADFETRVLSAATSGTGAARSPVSSTWIGGAVAAALTLGIALGVGFTGPDNPDGSETAGVEAASQPQNVRLAFNTDNAMDNVTLTVELPPHLEISGYPGYQQLSWNISLDEGQNIVNLPLKVLFPGEGELVAHLDNGIQKKTFRTSLSDTGASSLSEPVL